MENLIKTGSELLETLTSLNRLNDYHRKRFLDGGILVSTKVRKEFLLSEQQGKFILAGQVVRTTFENIGGGVWKVGIVKLNGEKYYDTN